MKSIEIFLRHRASVKAKNDKRKTLCMLTEMNNQFEATTMLDAKKRL